MSPHTSTRRLSRDAGTGTPAKEPILRDYGNIVPFPIPTGRLARRISAKRHALARTLGKLKKDQQEFSPVGLFLSSANFKPKNGIVIQKCFQGVGIAGAVIIQKQRVELLHVLACDRQHTGSGFQKIDVPALDHMYRLFGTACTIINQENVAAFRQEFYVEGVDMDFENYWEAFRIGDYPV